MKHSLPHKKNMRQTLLSHIQEENNPKNISKDSFAPIFKPSPSSIRHFFNEHIPVEVSILLYIFGILLPCFFIYFFSRLNEEYIYFFTAISSPLLFLPFMESDMFYSGKFHTVFQGSHFRAKNLQAFLNDYNVENILVSTFSYSFYLESFKWNEVTIRVPTEAVPIIDPLLKDFFDLEESLSGT